MNQHEEKINLLKKYYNKIKINNSFYIAGEIPYSKLDNALESFALELDISEILGFYDITMSETGKNGYIFSDTGIYYMEFFEASIELLQTLVVALGAGLGVWGLVNLLEGYGSDNAASKSHGIKQLMANLM